jgi:hypothetical protein
LAWALCIVSAILALASVALARFNGSNLIELVANHHALVGDVAFPSKSWKRVS